MTTLFRMHRFSSVVIWLALICGSLSSCANLGNNKLNQSGLSTNFPDSIQQLTSPELFTQRPVIPHPAALHALSDAQATDLLAVLNDPRKHRTPRHELLFKYLQDTTSNFTYYGQTLPASAALALQSGNCMSLAVLTTALAKVAGIEIGYQLMEDVPVFEYEGNLVIKGVHLRTILYQAAWTPPIFSTLLIARPGLQVDYFPTQRERFIANVSEARYLAMYYQNVAVEALEQGNLDSAYWHALEALHYAPNHSAAINTLAVAHRRSGDHARAEQLYLRGIEIAEDKLALLKNYQALLMYTGRTEEAAKIGARLDTMDDPSPYHWLHLAQSAEQAQDFASARRYYRKAIELAPNLHEAHLGLALASYQAGELQPARRALEVAIAKANKPATKRLYEAKLQLLNQLSVK